jgi:hypothetical protein
LLLEVLAEGLDFLAMLARFLRSGLTSSFTFVVQFPTGNFHSVDLDG